MKWRLEEHAKKKKETPTDRRGPCNCLIVKFWVGLALVTGRHTDVREVLLLTSGASVTQRARVLLCKGLQGCYEGPFAGWF